MTFEVQAQQSEPVQKDEEVIDVPLHEICQQQQSPQPKSTNQNSLCTNPPSAIQDLESLSQKLSSDKLSNSGKSCNPSDIAATCQNFESLGKVMNYEPLTIEVKSNSHGSEKKWKIKFYFSNAHTYYNKTTAKLNNSRMNVKISDLQPYERRSDSYYRFWEAENFSKALKWIDEPTNTFKISVERKNDEFFISIFHPKYVFSEGGAPEKNNNVHVTGTFDGVNIDKNMALNNENANSLNMIEWRNTHKLLQVELGYGKNIALAKSKGAPVLLYTPSVMAGVYISKECSSWVTPDGRVEDFSDGSNANNLKVIGYSASVGNRLTLRNRKDNIGAFVEHKFSYGKNNHDLFDGKVKHDISYNSISFGIQFTILKIK